MAENPPAGAVLDYMLKSAASSPLVLEILDAAGELVRRYASDDKPRSPDLQRIQTTPDWVQAPEPLSAAAGLHRFVWDLRHALPNELLRPSSEFRSESGPWAPPGRYTVRLTLAGKVTTQPLVVARDPRLPASITDADLVRQYELARDVQAERVRVAVGLRQADALRTQIGALRGTASGGAASALEALTKSIDRAAGPPVLTPAEERFGSRDADPTSLRRLASSLSELQSIVESADAAPTPDARAAFAGRRNLAAEGLARWNGLLAGEVAEVNRSLEPARLPPLKAE